MRKALPVYDKGLYGVHTKGQFHIAFNSRFKAIWRSSSQFNWEMNFTCKIKFSSWVKLRFIWAAHKGGLGIFKIILLAKKWMTLPVIWIIWMVYVMHRCFKGPRDVSLIDGTLLNIMIMLSLKTDFGSPKKKCGAISSLLALCDDHNAWHRSVRVAERLALPTSDHGVAGSNSAGGEILPEPKRRFIAQSLSCSPFHRLEMTEILLKGRKTLTHPPTMLDRKKGYQKRYITKHSHISRRISFYSSKFAGLKCITLMHLSMFSSRRDAEGIPWRLEQQESVPPKICKNTLKEGRDFDTLDWNSRRNSV